MTTTGEGNTCQCCGVVFEVPTGEDIHPLAYEYCDECAWARCDAPEYYSEGCPVFRGKKNVKRITDIFDKNSFIFHNG